MQTSLDEVDLRLNRPMNAEWRFDVKLDSFDSFVKIDSNFRVKNGLNGNRWVNVKTWRIARRIDRRLTEETEVEFFNIW